MEQAHDRPAHACATFCDDFVTTVVTLTSVLASSDQVNVNLGGADRRDRTYETVRPKVRLREGSSDSSRASKESPGLPDGSCDSRMADGSIECAPVPQVEGRGITKDDYSEPRTSRGRETTLISKQNTTIFFFLGFSHIPFDHKHGKK